MTRATQRQPSGLEAASLPLQLFAADACSKTRHQLLQRARVGLIDRLPATWVEKELGVKHWRLDKAFACHWLDSGRVLVGTKCNKLLELDLASGEKRDIPLPPEPANRQHATVDSGWGFCGIHSIDINPARDLLVTGGANPTDAVVLRLPDYQPLLTLTGHLDWVFGAVWVSDRHIVTGSRDGAIAIWDISAAADAAAAGGGGGGGGGGGAEGEHCVRRKDFHNKADMKRKFNPHARVRDVRYDFESDRVAALGTDGFMKLFDLERDLRVIRTIALVHTKELVCMAQRADCLAAGSCGHVTVADPRRREAEVRIVNSPDGAQGVRSVTLQGHLLSFGTGQGKLVFMDTRTWQPLQLGECRTAAPAPPCPAAGMELDPLPKPARTYLECGAGWLHQDELYWSHFEGMDVRNACYAHAWDPSRSRLFACGGPLAFGLKGCYMALWR